MIQNNKCYNTATDKMKWYIYIYIYIYICIFYIYLYAHTHTHTHTHIYVYVYKDISFIVTYMAVRITDRKQGKKINFLH